MLSLVRPSPTKVVGTFNLFVENKMHNIKNLLVKLKACPDPIVWVGDKTLEECWATCDRGDWMLWLAINLLPRKIVVKAACAVARVALKYELRSLKAIEITEAWCEDKATIEEVRRAASATTNTFAYSAANLAYAVAYHAAESAAYVAFATAAYCAATAAYCYGVTYEDARRESFKQSADIVRSIISVSMIQEAIDANQ